MLVCVSVFVCQTYATKIGVRVHCICLLYVCMISMQAHCVCMLNAFCKRVLCLSPFAYTVFVKTQSVGLLHTDVYNNNNNNTAFLYSAIPQTFGLKARLKKLVCHFLNN